jgi:hypothetical protein
VSLNHAFDIEAFAPEFFFDGGVIELSTDGATWNDVTTFGVDPGYPGIISVDFDNPLAGRPAFSGTSAGFPALGPLTLDFGSQFASQSVQMRFRIGTDFCCNQTGWLIDDVAVSGIDNTPFPGVVPEPSTCDAADDLVGGETARHVAPTRSLRPFDLSIARD